MFNRPKMENALSSWFDSHYVVLMNQTSALLRIYRSWSWRLALSYVLIFGLSVLALLSFVYVTTLSFIDNDINAGIKAESSVFVKEYERQGPPALIKSLKEHITENTSDGSVYLLVNEDYAPVMGTIPRWPIDLVQNGRWYSFAVEQFDKSDELVELGQGRAQIIHFENGTHLLIGNSLQQRDDFNEIIAQSVIWVMIAMVALAVLGGWYISRNVSKRIELVNRTTRHIMDGFLEERVPITGSNDEFDRLAINLNEMLATISRLIASMHEVTDNIAHDLRIPLTRIRSRLEITLLSEQHPETYRRAIEATITEADKLLATFNALLLIAETEARISADLRESVNLPLLAQDVIDLFQPLAESKDMAIEIIDRLSSPERTGTILGNRNLVFQALANLIDNAIKYGHNPESNLISLFMTFNSRENEIQLEIRDHGVGIPVDNLSHITDRFVRLENSRTTEGNGLGLSLVKAVLAMHRARLEFHDNHPGLVVRMIFPVPNMIPHHDHPHP